MPCSMYIRRMAPDFVKQYPTPLSQISTQWLAYLETTLRIQITHTRNGTEYRSGPNKIPVDGYCR